MLGLARGGVPVAWEVAAALGAPLDALVVRKLGAPGNPEFAIGALAPDGRIVVNDDMIRGPGIASRWLGLLKSKVLAIGQYSNQSCAHVFDRKKATQPTNPQVSDLRRPPCAHELRNSGVTGDDFLGGKL